MKSIFLLFLFAAGISQSLAQDIYTFEKSKEFASYLYKSGQYQLSAVEYERLLFVDETNDSLKLALVDSYYKNDELKRAIDRTESLYPSYADFTQPMSDLYLQMLIIGKQFEKFDKNAERLPLSEEKRSIYQLHRDVMAGDWDDVQKKIPQLSTNDHPSISGLRGLSTKADAFKPKKPWVAVMMSAILPGSGKFYTANIKDGIFSLLVVGGSAFQAYRGFNKDGISSTSGWIFGALSTGFYAGNIYGSAKSAQVYNQSFWLEIEKDAEDIIRATY